MPSNGLDDLNFKILSGTFVTYRGIKKKLIITNYIV